jgi:hypothetical protein
MTKLWYLTLKPPTTVSSPPFHQLWAEVLSFCSTASGPISSGHTLWQDAAARAPPLLVMLSGYPRLSSNLAADKEYVASGFTSRMAQFVEHGRLLQIELDVNALPLQTEVLCIDTFTTVPSEEDEERQMVEGIEIGKGGGAREKVWLRFKGFGSEDVEKLAEEERTDRFQTVYLRKIMG